MPCSPERLAANRRNAQLSTGPRTSEGKERSRRNAFKHGLTGEGIALPDEDAAEVQDRFEAFEKDLKPANEVARFLARKAALLSVRLDRCARQESAALTRNMIRAEEAEADDRQKEMEHLIDWIRHEPATAARRLRRTPEGVDWMIRSWEDLKGALLHEGADLWSWSHRERADNLTGRTPEGLQTSRISALSRVINGDFQGLGPDDWPGLTPAGRREAARAELASIIDGELARLRLDRDSLDLEAIAAGRANAAGRALFDASREAVLARKYEAAADRGFFQTLREIERINAEAGPVEATGSADEICGELASSGSVEAPEAEAPPVASEVADRRPETPALAAVEAPQEPTRPPVPPQPSFNAQPPPGHPTIRG